MNNLKELYKKDVDLFDNSKYFKALKDTIFNILKNNKLGLTFNEISNQIELNVESKEDDIKKVLDIFLKERIINTSKGKKPEVYYLIKVFYLR